MQSIYARRLSFLVFLALAAALSMAPYIHRPLEWFETLFHESSHGLAAVLTGGQAYKLELSTDGSGLMWTGGGVRALVSFAGYAGAICWGSLLYLTASAVSGRTARKIAMGLVAAGSLETMFWLSWDPVTLGIMTVILVTLSLLLWRRAAPLARPALRLIGLYVLVSGIRSPTYILAAGGAHNDAADLQAILLLPQIMWVGIWCAMGLIALMGIYWVEARADRRRTQQDALMAI